MAAIINKLKNGSSSSSGTDTISTTGTLNSTGLYARPDASNANVPGNIRSVANNLAYTREVGPDGLVEDRLNNMLADGSRYISQAEARGKRFAASRGNINATMAGDSAIGEAYNAALPIVSQDASAINAASGQNVDVLNANLMQERDLLNKAILEQNRSRDAASAYAAGNRDFQQQMQHDLQMQRERLGYEGEQAGLNRAFGMESMGAEFGFRNQLSDNDAFRQDWLGNSQFNREFYGTMATMFAGAGINNSSTFFSQLNNYALNNPDIFDAENYSQVSNFINQTMSQQLSAMFANLMGGGG